jgi:hypothetical protein
MNGYHKIKVLRVLVCPIRSIEEAIINKSELLAWEFKIVYHLSKDTPDKLGGRYIKDSLARVGKVI